MRPGDYRVQVHIIEAKDIIKKKGTGFIEGDTPDPMVEVSVLH